MGPDTISAFHRIGVLRKLVTIEVKTPTASKLIEVLRVRTDR